MNTSREAGLGGYHTGEKWAVIKPVTMPENPKLAVICHGSAADGWFYNDIPSRRRDLEVLARAGVVVLAIDHGNPLKPDNWGNDVSVARVSEAITWAGTTFGCDTTKVAILGDSAGGATALNWAKGNVAQTGAVVLRAGVCNIGAIYQAGAGNPLLVELIDDAYDAAWPAAAATHDPALNISSFQPLASRMRLYYAGADGLVPPAATVAFAEAVGCRAITYGDMDHSETDVQPAIPAEAQAQFILQQLAA